MTGAPLPNGARVNLSDQNSDGVWTLVSSTVSAVTPANYSSSEDVIRALLRVWPNFRPLWITNTYRSPNGGLKSVSFHAIAHYDPRGQFDKRIITGLVLPSTKLYGIEWKQPIYLDDIVDGLSNYERKFILDPFAVRSGDARLRQRRVFPRYQPLTHGLVGQVQQHLDEVEADELAVREAAEKAKTDLADYARYAVKHDRPLSPKSSRTRYVLDEPKGVN